MQQTGAFAAERRAGFATPALTRPFDVKLPFDSGASRGVPGRPVGL